MNRIVFVFSLIFFIATLYAEWPVELSVPVSSPPLPLTSSIKSTQTNGISTFKSDNEIQLVQEDSVKKIIQLIEYSFYDDDPLRQKENYINLDGEFIGKKFPFAFTELGFNWSPTILLNTNEERGIGVGSLKIGPTIKINYNTLPIVISGGGAIDTWNDSIPPQLGESKLSDVNLDGGGYFGVEVGDNQFPLFEGIPFYAEGEIFGTYMSNSNITSGLVNALFVKTLPKKGEFYFYAADTLTKGRMVNYSRGNFGTVDYTSSYDRTNNDMKGMLGIRDLGRKYLSSSFLYTFNLSTMNYPFSNVALDENRFISNSISMFLSNKKQKWFGYDGWINFELYNIDMLYRSDLPDTTYTGVNNIDDKFERYDSLVSNEDDMDGKYVEFDNKFFLNILNKAELHYHINLNKDSKRYPRRYLYSDGRSTIREDRDIVNYEHEVIVKKDFNEFVYGEMLFDYKKKMDVFIRSEKSASNRYLRKYIAEIILGFTKKNGSYINEKIGISNDQEEFPDYVLTFLEEEYLSGNELGWKPFFSRKFYSRLDWRINLNDYLAISGYWYETLRDRGYWDIEKWKSESGYGSDKYIIQYKYIETSLQGALSLFPISTQEYTIGGYLQNVINKPYNSEENDWVQTISKQYDFKFNPYIAFKFLVNNRAYLRGKIKCNSLFKVNTSGDRVSIFSDFEIDYWEAATSLEVKF